MKKLLSLLFSISALVLFGLFAKKLFDIPTQWHNSILAGSLAWMKGYPLYQGLHITHPVLSSIYPPLGYLAYAPSLAFQTPTTAVFAGRFFAMFYYFTPILFISWRGRRFYSLLIFGFIVFYCLPLLEAGFAVNVDAPALGFGAMACAFLCFIQDENDRRNLFFSAACAMLSVWCKQVMLPIPFVLTAWLFLAEGRRTAYRYLLFLALLGSAVSSFFIFLFHPQELFLNLLYMPGHHPWIDPNPLKALSITFKIFADYAALPLIPVLACFFLEIAENPEAGTNWRKRLKTQRWPIFFVTGLAMIPLSLLGRVKAGGAHNTFSYSLYFFAISSVLAVTAKNDAFRKSLAASILLVLLALKTPSLLNFPEQVRGFYPNEMSRAYHYLKRHPKEAYFPLHPLSSLMADGTLMPVQAGLNERKMAGIPVSDEEFHATLPYRPKRICFPPGSEQAKTFSEHPVMKYFPDYTNEVKVEELPGWVIYEKYGNKN